MDDISRSIKEERIRVQASYIADQLCALFPDGMPTISTSDDDDNDKHLQQVETTLQQIMKALHQRMLHSDFGNIWLEGDNGNMSVNDTIRIMFRTGVQKWKEEIKKNSVTSINNTSSNRTTAKQSFSLLDQLTGGFAPPITLEEIQEATTSESRFQVFEKVEFIDDLVPDWEEINLILKKELSKTNSDVQQSGTLRRKYLELYRKLYHKCRSSIEYTNIRYDLCHNVLDSIIEHLGTVTGTTTGTSTIQNEELEGEEKLTNIDNDNNTDKEDDMMVRYQIQTWYDMFLDLMQCDLYSSTFNQIISMEVKMMVLFLRANKNCTATTVTTSSTTTSSKTCPILSSIDYDTKWFQSWINHIHYKDLIPLLELCNVLPYLISTIQMEKTIDDSTDQLLQQQEEQQEQEQHFALSILIHILEKTRVIHFPWILIFDEDINSSTSTTSTSKSTSSSLILSYDDVSSLMKSISTVEESIMKTRNNDKSSSSSPTEEANDMKNEQDKQQNSTLMLPDLKHLIAFVDVLISIIEKKTTKKKNCGSGDNDSTVALCCRGINVLKSGCIVLESSNRDSFMTYLNSKLESLDGDGRERLASTLQ